MAVMLFFHIYGQIMLELSMLLLLMMYALLEIIFYLQITIETHLECLKHTQIEDRGEGLYIYI